MKEFSKAIKVEVEEIKNEILCDIRQLTDKVCDRLIELGVEILYNEFYKMVLKEAEARKWDLRYFRNSKNEPVLNLFKRLIRNLCKERKVELSNDELSRLLNVVRRCYSDDALLTAGLYPAESFFKRDYYDIPEDLGDENSCFRSGGCNEGSALWLVEEWKNYQRSWFIIFHYKSGNKEGVGRCWVYTLPNAVYVTNFYSYKFEIKDDRFKKPIVKLVSRLFNLSENVKFATVGKNVPLPIYLNGDGIVIYEPLHFKHSSEVLNSIMDRKSKCMWCNNEVEIKELRRYDESVKFGERMVNGLVICMNCSYSLDDMVYCEDCGEMIYADEAHFVEGVGYICRNCFEDGWFYCSECNQPERREYGICTSDGWLCEYCAFKLGAVCELCGEFVYFDSKENYIEQYRVNKGERATEIFLCEKCAKYLGKYQCVLCGKEEYYLSIDFKNYDRLRDMVRLGLCFDCYKKRMIKAYEKAFCNSSLFAFAMDPGERVLLEILIEEI